jgi:Flp pilus assembly pilin Flp
MFRLDELRRKLSDLVRSVHGQTMAEYAVVLGVISSTTVVLFFPGLSTGVANAITSVARLLP